jgi:3',5'-cyclic AMP phosphodiesterase CpdA
MRILHLSDLHYGAIRAGDGKPTKPAHFFTTAGAIDPNGLANVLFADDALADAPDVIVVSGDVGWSGCSDDYRHASEFVKLLRAKWGTVPLVIAPGNHDVDQGAVAAQAQDEFVAFVRAIYGSEDEYLIRDVSLSPREQLITIRALTCSEGEPAVIVAVNSAAHLTERNATPVYVRPEVLKAVAARLKEVPVDALRVFVLHHHILPFAEPHWQATTDAHDLPDKADPTIVGNSARLQTWLSETGFHLVLHGHKHQAHGRADRLWHREHAGGQQLVVVGAGSASVEREHVRPDPHAYNVISALRSTSRRWNIQVDVRQVSETGAYPQAKELFQYLHDTGTDERDSPVVFHSDRSDQCHALIKRALFGKKAANFISVVNQHEYQHPKTAELEGHSVSAVQVLRSFKALHPEYTPSDKWRKLEVIKHALRGLSPRFQFQHGPRLFGLGEGSGAGPEASPIVRAVDRLKNSPSSKAYVSLFSRSVDVLGEGREPLPALLSIQFIRPDSTHLDVVATFRKIELSFWWVVNMFELGELLRWAAERLRLTARRITFFAAEAEWKTTNVEAAFATDLDDLSLRELVELVNGVMKNDAGQVSKLTALLAEKKLHTHSQNLDVAGLDRTVSVLAGLLPSLGPRKGKDLHALHEVLAEAADHIRKAMADVSKEDGTLVATACDALGKAIAALARQSEAR